MLLMDKLKIVKDILNKHSVLLRKAELALLASLFGIFFIIIFSANFATNGEQQFIYQAQAFLDGHLNILDMPGTWHDMTLVDGKYYWPIGPFPAVPLLPFVMIFGYSFMQGYLHFFITAGICAFAYFLARKFEYSKRNAAWLAFAYCFASVTFNIIFISWSWYYAQAVTVFLLMWSLFEFYHKQRWWLIGILMAAVLASRLGVAICSLFFVLQILWSRNIPKEKIKNLALLLIPILGSFVLLSVANYLRFGDIMDNGYATQIVGGIDGVKLEIYGLFSADNFLTNIFFYFFQIPYFLPWRQATTDYITYPEVFYANFFIISPLFLWVFVAIKKSWRKKEVWMPLVGCSVTLILLMFYYASGMRLGPRYMADILPLLFLVLLVTFHKRKLFFPHKLLIVGSAIFNATVIIWIFTILHKFG